MSSTNSTTANSTTANSTTAKKSYPPIFPTTQWSIIEAARGRDPQLARDAMTRFFLAYRDPMLRYAGKITNGIDAQTLEEFVTDFIGDEVIRGKVMSAVRQDKGKFRSYLATCLRHFIYKRLKYESRYCLLGDRDGSVASDASDSSSANFVAKAEHSSDDAAMRSKVAAADLALNVDWAVVCLNKAIGLMHDHCVQRGKIDIWRVFEGRILNQVAQSRELVPYHTLAEELALDLKSTMLKLTTGQRMFKRMMNQVVGSYVSGDEDIKQEIEDLYAVARQAPTGWYSGLEVRIP